MILPGFTRLSFNGLFRRPLDFADAGINDFARFYEGLQGFASNVSLGDL